MFLMSWSWTSAKLTMLSTLFVTLYNILHTHIHSIYALVYVIPFFRRSRWYCLRNIAILLHFCQGIEMKNYNLITLASTVEGSVFMAWTTKERSGPCERSTTLLLVRAVEVCSGRHSSTEQLLCFPSCLQIRRKGAKKEYWGIFR